MSGRRDSNPRPQPWQGCALPTELLPQLSNITVKFFILELKIYPVEPKPLSDLIDSSNFSTILKFTLLTFIRTNCANRSFVFIL